MTIASEITRINNNIASAYTACNGKGATMPATQNSANLATCIGSIQTGGGGFNVREVINGVFTNPTTINTLSLPSGANDLSEYCLYYLFPYFSGVQRTQITDVDFSSLTAISGQFAMQHAFSGAIVGSIDLSNVVTIDNSGCRDLFNGGDVGSVDFSSLTTVNTYGLCYAFAGTTLSQLDLSSLTTVNGDNALEGMCRQGTANSSLTSIDLSGLTTVKGGVACSSILYQNTGITSIDLSSLITVEGTSAFSSAFYGCTNLASISFYSLQTIGKNSSTVDNGQFRSAFYNCNAITSLSFPNLEKIYCTGGTNTSLGTFSGNNKVQKMYFPKLDTITYGTGASTTNQNACKNVFYGCSALTELHFGAANQSAIEASPGYSTAWGLGAGNVTIYFDL